MRARSTRVALGALVAVSAAACAVDPSGSPTPDPGAGSPAAGADVEARIQQIIDSRYRREDVRHSFRTKFGEDVDCIDFEAQPGVKARRAQGLPVNEHPPAEPDWVAAKRRTAAAARPVREEDDFSFNGKPDENGHARGCPDHTVPVLRLHAEDVRRAGGPDEFLKPRPKSAPPKAVPPDCDVPGYAHVVATISPDTSQPVAGGFSTMQIFNPQLPAGATWDHSLAQTWTYGGGNTSCAKPTGPSKMATIEVGWMVDPGMFFDTNTHLFSFGTVDGYWNTGCYDNDSTKPAGYGPNIVCPPYYSYSGAPYTLGQTLPTGHDLTALTINFGNTATDWQLQVGIDTSSYYIGVFPSLPVQLTTFQTGGEVYDESMTMRVYPLEMGTGDIPSWGYGLNASAAIHDYWLLRGTAGNLQDIETVAGGFTDGETAPVDVSMDFDHSQSMPGASGWSNYFFYGGEIPYCTVYPLSIRCRIKHF